MTVVMLVLAVVESPSAPAAPSEPLVASKTPGSLGQHAVSPAHGGTTAPNPAPGESLTVEAALVLARSHRAQARLAAAATAAARADRRAALSLPNPSASYTYTGESPRRHAVVDQPLDWMLRRGGVGAATRADVHAASADSAQLLAQVVREATIAFYTSLGAQRRLALAADEAALADSLAALSRVRFAAGEAPELEQAQAALEAARARQQVSASREEQDVARAELGRALGVSSDSLPALAGSLETDLRISEPEPRGVDGFPDVAFARAEFEAARARSREAEWARIPFPSLQGGAEWDDPSRPGASPTILLGLSVPLPLWQNGSALAAAARARADEADARLQEAHAAASKLQAQTIVRVREAARRATVASDSILPLAVRQRELALLEYQAGDTGIVPVLDALRAEREVVRELVTDLVDFQAARADWLALIGGAE